MNSRGALVLAILSSTGACHAQQPQVAATVSYTLHWTNTATGDQSPLFSGQSANLTLTARLTPAPETIVPVAAGLFASGNTQGALRRIFSMFLDLQATAAGTWTNQHVYPLWDLVGSSGYGTPQGSSLIDIQAGNFGSSWLFILPLDPVQFWSGTWTPASYEPSSASFTIANGTSNPSSFSTLVFIRDGNSPIVYTGTAANDFGSIHILMIPAPSAIALLGFSALFATRRQRR